MKIIIDTEDDKALDALADAIAARLLASQPATQPAPAAAPAKPAGKAKPAPKADVDAPKATETKKVIRDDVHAALSVQMKAKGKEAALAVLHKYSATLSGLAEEDFAKVIAELNGEAPAEVDPFG